MGQLDGLYHTTEFHPFVAPVKLRRITGREHQGHKGLGQCGTGLFPALHKTLYAVVSPGIARALKALKQTAGGTSLLFRALAILLQPGLQLIFIGAQLWLGLLPSLVTLRITLVQILANRIARQVKTTGNLTDAFTVHFMTATNLGNGFHSIINKPFLSFIFYGLFSY